MQATIEQHVADTRNVSDVSQKHFLCLGYKFCHALNVSEVAKLRNIQDTGPVTLHNFLSNLSRNAIARQVAGELHTVTWVVSQFLLLREALHEVELSSTFRNGLQQLTTPLHSVSPLQQLVSQFYGSFNKGACAHFLFFVPRTHCETTSC